MSAAVFLFVFIVSVNSHCETRCQVNQNSNPNSYPSPYQDQRSSSYQNPNPSSYQHENPNSYQNTNPNPYHDQNSQAFQAVEEMRDDGTTVTQQIQQTNDAHFQATTDVHLREGCSGGDLIPNSEDCTSYYECANGQYELRLCPSGYFFDPAAKCCRADYVCPNRAREPPTTSTPSCNYGELRADVTSCRNYYSCVGDDRHFERRICPDGKIFDRRLSRCVSGDAESKCRESQAPAQAYDSRDIGVGLACTESSGPSGYSADPTDCRHFYQCAQGRWVRMRCATGLVWNPAATVCDWPKNTLLTCKENP